MPTEWAMRRTPRTAQRASSSDGTNPARWCHTHRGSVRKAGAGRFNATHLQLRRARYRTGVVVEVQRRWCASRLRIRRLKVNCDKGGRDGRTRQLQSRERRAQLWRLLALVQKALRPLRLLVLLLLRIAAEFCAHPSCG
jgi:hypothetical protein